MARTGQKVGVIKRVGNAIKAGISALRNRFRGSSGS